MKKLIMFLLAFTVMTSVVLAQKNDKKMKGSEKHAATPEVVSSKDAPPAIGPYSQAIKVGGFVFVAGSTGRDPATGKLVEGGIAEQTDRVLKNLSAVLTAAGSSMDKVVKTTVFLKNISDFGKMNEVYATYFKANPPARSTIGVGALPGDGLVEIDVIAQQ
jgi:2-iminobutanoate/2-iminopropanoate deaminase